MAENYCKEEQWIALALAEPFKGRRRNLRVLAIKYGVPYCWNYEVIRLQRSCLEGSIDNRDDADDEY